MRAPAVKAVLSSHVPCRRPLVIRHTCCLPPVSKRARPEVRLAGARPCRCAPPSRLAGNAPCRMPSPSDIQRVIHIHWPLPMLPVSERVPVGGQAGRADPSWRHSYTHARKATVMPCLQVLLVATWLCLAPACPAFPADLERARPARGEAARARPCRNHPVVQPLALQPPSLRIVRIGAGQHQRFWMRV